MRGQLDLLVLRFRCVVVDAMIPEAVDPVEVPVDECVSGLRSVGDPRRARGANSAYSSQECSRGTRSIAGPRLDFTPFAANHVLPALMSSGTSDRTVVDGVGSHARDVAVAVAVGQPESSRLRSSSTATAQSRSTSSSGRWYGPPKEPSPRASRQASARPSREADAGAAASFTRHSTPGRRVHGKFSDQDAWSKSSSISAATSSGRPSHTSCQSTAASW